MTENYQIIKDSVHGLIDLKPLIFKIIDTTEFQRLRHLKQLETLSYIYPCSVHTRFEHSIGTSYLARQFIEHLQINQPELNLSKKEALCVEIAGLCHDLGHGPFSHMFEDLAKKVYKKRHPDAPKSEIDDFFVHEEASMLIFDRIFDKLSDEFKAEGLTIKECQLIKEMINPSLIKDIYKEYERLKKEKNPKTKATIKKKISRKEEEFENKFGVTVEKAFLFEIVSNYRNKIDVDKWDYFARDSLHLGINNTFDYKRYILTSRVINPDKTLNQICARDKELRNVYEMFRTREDLHRRAYQLPKAIGIKVMVIDALCELDDLVGFYEIIANIRTNIDAYLKLDDRIVYITNGAYDDLINLDNHKLEKLTAAQNLIRRLESRKLYKIVSIQIMNRNGLDESSIHKTRDELVKSFKQIKHEDLEIIESVINFGNKNKDPLEFLNFYVKNTYEIVKKEDISAYNSEMRPHKFEEMSWILILKPENLCSNVNLIKRLKEDFENICKKNNLNV